MNNSNNALKENFELILKTVIYTLLLFSDLRVYVYKVINKNKLCIYTY